MGRDEKQVVPRLDFQENALKYNPEMGDIARSLPQQIFWKRVSNLFETHTNRVNPEPPTHQGAKSDLKSRPYTNFVWEILFSSGKVRKNGSKSGRVGLRREATEKKLKR